MRICQAQYDYLHDYTITIKILATLATNVTYLKLRKGRSVSGTVGLTGHHAFAADARLSLSAIFTKSASELASIFLIT
jgi:hypothetical protein